MSILATVLYGVGGFIILVFFHEFGHFLMAKWGGVGVEEFSVGMGKAIWKKRYKGTLYKIGLVPFGGYCKLKGQDDFGPVKPSVEQDNYFSRPPFVRFLISFGGPFFSYLLGFVFLALSLFMQGENKLMLTKISTTPQNAILQDGDLIKAVGGKEVSDWQALQTELLSSNQTGVQVTLIRDGQKIEVTYVPDMEKNELITYHDTVTVNRVEEGFPAQEAGFQKGDQIAFINGKKVNDNLDLIYLVQWETVPMVYRTFTR
ncbi:MAG: RIP metalloprotease RseP, partial [Spirochaetae bacterium HGW-Spirochaetae-6]